MRVLATIAFSFAAAVLTAVLLPWADWYLWAGSVLTVCAGLSFLVRRRWSAGKPAAIICAAMAAGFLYFAGYQALIVRPASECCSQEPESFTAKVSEYPVSSEYGVAVTITLNPGVRGVLYGDDSLLDLEPGQIISGTALLQESFGVQESDTAFFTERGVFLLVYQRSPLSVEQDRGTSPLYWTQLLAKTVHDRIPAIWQDPTVSAFMAAELTGDSSGITEEDTALIRQTGLAYLITVPGLHCAFLVTLFCLLAGDAKRKAFCFALIPILLLLMIASGLTPSVTQACIMQVFLLADRLFHRKSDPISALAVSVLFLLLVNPYSAGGISLQLNFAVTLGLVLLSERIYRFVTAWYKGGKKGLRRILAFVAANVSASVSAILFAIPLVAYHFGVFSLISPISAFLAAPIAAWNYLAGWISVFLNFLWMPAGRIFGCLCWAMVHLILLAARLLAHLPFRPLYYTNRYMKYWITYVYALLGICFLGKGTRRRFFSAAVLAVFALLLTIGLNGREYRYGAMNAVAVNVGQGECVLLYSGDSAVLVDCGSGNSFINAGSRAADQINSIGIKRLSALVLTHFHYDHTSGVYDLLKRVKVEKLFIPDIDDDFGIRDRILQLAERYGISVSLIRSASTMPLGEAEITVYPPIGAGDMNEQGLTVLCSARDFDLLITGDMPGTTEKALIETYVLPDVEVLLVSHHGSRYSSSQEFLKHIRPDTAIISVGENSYGHPTQEAMTRLQAAGAEIYRTDEQGSILVTVYGGEG